MMWFISCGDILEFLKESDFDISFMNNDSECEVVPQEVSVKDLLKIIQHSGSHRSTY
jgi:hypothetical protein